MKKNIKTKNKFLNFVPNLSNNDGNDYIRNVLAIFLLFIVFIYGAAFYVYGKKVANEKLEDFSKSPSMQEMRINRMVKDSPIARMTPYILQKDPKTASFLVAIAKKESNWGKYSPKKGKKECYNYWGYRGTYNQTVSGYSCFKSERQAVNVVGNRIEELIKQGIDTPEKMIVWKCGESCDGHSQKSVQKWIGDVDLYYNKINS